MFLGHPLYSTCSSWPNYLKIRFAITVSTNVEISFDEKRIGKLFFPIGRCQKERRMILSQMAIVGKTSIFSATSVAQLLTMAVCEAKYKHSEY